MHGEDKLHGLPRMRNFPLKMNPGDLVLCLYEDINFGTRGIVQEIIEKSPFPWDIAVKFEHNREPIWYPRGNLLLVERNVQTRNNSLVSDTP